MKELAWAQEFRRPVLLAHAKGTKVGALLAEAQEDYKAVLAQIDSEELIRNDPDGVLGDVLA